MKTDHLHWIGKSKILTKEEEHHHILMAKRGVKTSVDALCKSCARYVMRYVKARASRSSSVDVNDLFSEAMLGVIEAIEPFDFSKNVKFLSYALVHVKKRVNLFYNAEHLDLYVPLNKRGNMLKAIAHLNNSGQSKEEYEVQEGVHGVKLEEAFVVTRIDSTLDDNDQIDIMDVDYDNEQTGKMNIRDATKLISNLGQFFEGLSPIRVKVFKLWCGFPDKEATSLDDVAEQLGLCRYTVTRYVKETIKLIKLRSKHHKPLKEIAEFLY